MQLVPKNIKQVHVDKIEISKNAVYYFNGENLVYSNAIDGDFPKFDKGEVLTLRLEAEVVIGGGEPIYEN
jgi:hypothetical protein